MLPQDMRFSFDTSYDTKREFLSVFALIFCTAWIMLLLLCSIFLCSLNVVWMLCQCITLRSKCVPYNGTKNKLVLMSLEWEFVFFLLIFSCIPFWNSHLTISIATFLKDIRRESRVVKWVLVFCSIVFD